MKFLELHELQGQQQQQEQQQQQQQEQQIRTTSSLLRGQSQRQSSTMQTRTQPSLPSFLPAPPNVYNLPQDKMWLKTNNEKEITLKSRDSNQELPLWDPYWQTHKTAMPTFLSSAIANNAYLHFKNSPFDLYWRNKFGVFLFSFFELLLFFLLYIYMYTVYSWKKKKNIYYLSIVNNVNLTCNLHLFFLLFFCTFTNTSRCKWTIRKSVLS